MQRTQKTTEEKASLPSIVMGNVRSLGNKMDELTALVQSQKEYRECSLICFTETWLHQDVPDENTTIKGFHTVRVDRDSVQSGKRKGGGLCRRLKDRVSKCRCHMKGPADHLDLTRHTQTRERERDKFHF